MVNSTCNKVEGISKTVIDNATKCEHVVRDSATACKKRTFDTIDKVYETKDQAVERVTSVKAMAVDRANSYKDMAVDTAMGYKDAALQRANSYKDYAVGSVIGSKVSDAKDAAIDKVKQLQPLFRDIYERIMDNASLEEVTKALTERVNNVKLGEGVQEKLSQAKVKIISVLPKEEFVRIRALPTITEQALATKTLLADLLRDNLQTAQDYTAKAVTTAKDNIPQITREDIMDYLKVIVWQDLYARVTGASNWVFRKSNSDAGDADSAAMSTDVNTCLTEQEEFIADNAEPESKKED